VSKVAAAEKNTIVEDLKVGQKFKLFEKQIKQLSAGNGVGAV
jgi:hypothetical protein